MSDCFYIYSKPRSPAACCNEAFKIATSSAAYLNNYFMLIGTEGVYSYTFEHEKRKDCPVCGGEAVDMTLKPNTTVEQLIDILVEKQDMYVSYFSSVFCCGQPSTKLAKSRNPLYPLGRSIYTSKHHHNWSKQRDPTWRRRYLSSYLTAEISLLLLLLCLSTWH